MVSAMNRACGRGTVGELVGELPDREPYRMLSYFAERASAAIRLRTSLGPQTVGFKFCLDDCEVLSGLQRKSINSLVRLSRAPCTRGVSSRWEEGRVGREGGSKCGAGGAPDQ